jgi:membrane-bound lytic murein transglycosylase B
MSQRPHVLITLALTLMLPLSAAAQSGFVACLDRLRGAAVEQGVTAATVERVVPAVRERPRVIESDRNQPEFVDTFGSYLGRRVTPERVVTGRQLLERHRALLDSIGGRYGVPPQVIVAFWGLETSYGRVLGDVPVFDSLATLACDARRTDYFSTEFVNALKIVDRGIEPSRMIGSWAGAMGQTQFMPSVYLEHAVDGDGDGVVDLWGSVADAFASAANFLRSLGWKSGWRWGREVLLPEDFDYYLAGRDAPRRALEEWRNLGVVTLSGAPVDASAEPASLLVPAGARGPAFLVYGNFDAIMRWNRSEFFALTVGHLSDRLAGGAPLNRAPAVGQRLDRGRVAALQRKLNELGYDSGEPDGIVGSATRRAVREWQRANARVADGHVDLDLLQELNILEEI